MPKYQIWCESDVPCAQDPSLPIWLIWEVPDPVDRYSRFSIPTSVWVIEAYVQIFKSVALCVRMQSCLPQTDGRIDRHSSNVLEFCADQMSPRNIGSQIIKFWEIRFPVYNFWTKRTACIYLYMFSNVSVRTDELMAKVGVPFSSGKYIYNMYIIIIH